MISNDLERVGPITSERPPSKLPCGKRNPAYGRWYRSSPAAKKAKAERQTPEGREKQRIQKQKWRKTEKGRAAVKRYNKSDLAKAAKERYLTKKKEALDREIQCAECGQVFCRESAISRGWKILDRYRCICDLCD